MKPDMSYYLKGLSHLYVKFFIGAIDISEITKQNYRQGTVIETA